MFKSTLTAAITTLAILPTASFAEDYNLTVVTGHPSVFRWVRMIDEAFIPAATEALEAQGHSVTFQTQYGGAIAGVGEELETVESGLAEIGVCLSVFDPAKLAEPNVTYYTPFVSTDPRMIAKVMEDLHESEPAMSIGYAENGVTYIGAPVILDDYFIMSDFPINTPQDLDGRRIAGAGPNLNWLSGTGAVGVAGNLTTFYNEIQNGVYEGAFLFASAAIPSRLYEVAPHVTRARFGAQFAGGLCVNSDWIEDQPAEVVEALSAGADAAGAWYLDDLEAAVAAAYAQFDELGITVVEMSPADNQAWADAMDDAAQTWVSELDERGRSGTAVLNAYMDAMRAAGAEPLRTWDAQ
ncbi:C4-dicarboxylate TRAP transporter substrate-binding protein [Octadecabacter sp.]|nr:C4-dicarboxylate TRAP transporter substrate-binding protein [Octadecabacter sp.]